MSEPSIHTITLHVDHCPLGRRDGWYENASPGPHLPCVDE